MRIMVLLLVMVSSSSCVGLAVGVGLGVMSGTVALQGSRSKAKLGALREAQMREQHAREAEVIRARYKAMEKASVVVEDEGPSTPPLVTFEPVRTPLRPRH